MRLFEKLKDRNTLNCFSPEVMLVTFIVEIILAVYILIKYKLSAFNRAAIMLLFFLGMFQLAEFQICQGNTSDFWLKTGLVSITILPVIGLYMISEITGKKSILKAAYMIALLYVGYFTLVADSIKGAYCGGNYIIFDIPSAIYQFYGFYYFGFLFFAIWEAWESIKENIKFKSIMTWFIIGYFSFIAPMGIVYIFSDQARGAVESIMCGFAIFLALIVVFKIVPLYQKLNLSKNNK